MWNLEKMVQMSWFAGQKLRHRCMDTKGGKPRWGGNGGVLNWAAGIDMYTLMCIKLMTNKNLQYKKTNKQAKQLILNFHWVICMELC